MKRRSMLALLAAGTLVPSLPLHAAAVRIQVFKSAACGCCGAWIDHLEAAGFAVSATNVADPGAVRRRYGMPDALGSCHTALVDGYVLEGHVPAADIKRLLAERPSALGLAVPGMPAGSPGMEMGVSQSFDVVLVDRAGGRRAYAHYPPR